MKRSYVVIFRVWHLHFYDEADCFFRGKKNKSQLNYIFFMIFFKALTKQRSLLEYVSLHISLTTLNLE